MRLRKIRTKELRGAVRMEAVWDPDAQSKTNNQEITLPLVPVQSNQYSTAMEAMGKQNRAIEQTASCSSLHGYVVNQFAVASCSYIGKSVVSDNFFQIAFSFS